MPGIGSCGGPSGSSRGGSRGQARCRALLDAASALFVEKGFALTSLSDIIDKAGGSRNTLYGHFGGKEGLFRAMLEEHCSRIVDELADVQTTSAMNPAEGLNRFGLHIARTFTAPETAAILRILVSEGGRIPDIAETFFRIGPERTAGRLADYLRDLAEVGCLRIDDPDTAAQLFCGMVIGHLLPKRLILPDEPITDAEVEAIVRQSVSLFLQGTRTARTASHPPPQRPS
ncbi:TetR/AcrR family transcriptional regulator [Azospirillum soli]|uniref:TetR/AcrR family transcriptional regulator n=1 Tax=Azospirillum soli TaxID=1304799 RepID=UPI001AE8884C|nr:TetR/AcrR family transcriptional regulator [Azospirillum soli]MBP2314568.1 AcrR family transcriptional regulator [Azospirillum soli]